VIYVRFSCIVIKSFFQSAKTGHTGMGAVKWIFHLLIDSLMNRIIIYKSDKRRYI
jgi:hypothetical protein